MGGSSTAKSETNILGRAITNILMQSSQSCSASSLNVQEIKFNNIVVKNCPFTLDGISQTIDSKVNLDCAQNIKQETALKNELSSELDKQVSSLTEGVTTSTSSSESISNIKTEIINNISISTISQCVITAINKQKLSLEKWEFDCTLRGDVTIKNIEQTIISNSVLKCIQSNNTLNNLSNKLDTAVKETVSSTNKGLSMSSTLIIILVVCLIVSSLASIYFMIPSRSAQVAPQLLTQMQQPQPRYTLPPPPQFVPPPPRYTLPPPQPSVVPNSQDLQNFTNFFKQIGDSIKGSTPQVQVTTPPVGSQDVQNVKNFFKQIGKSIKDYDFIGPEKISIPQVQSAPLPA